MMIDELTLYLPEGAFLLPYLRRELPGVTLSDIDGAHRSQIAIMVSSADIYMRGPIVGADEESSIDRTSPWAGYEQTFTAYCSAAGIPGTILRCGDIVGTGMTGFPRALAEAIYRGRFFHFPGNEARRSVVHATAVARTIANIASTFNTEKASPEETTDTPRTTSATPHVDPGTVAIVNLHDGSNPTIDALADALAYRIHNKRISNLSLPFQQRAVRRLYGADTYALYTTTRTLVGNRKLPYIPTDMPQVCQYLRTHEYDDNSL